MSQNGLQLRVRMPRAAFSLDVDLHLPAAAITVLYGTSGSGKTSLLRCVAGLEQPPEALIGLGDAVWHDSARQHCLPVWQRPIGYVFQEASLFAHLRVRGNLEYGMRRVRGGRPQQTLDAAIALLGLEHLLDRQPQQLSGGERQRVAVARAVCTQPQLLLLDEPLASLDAPRRAEVMPWLERLRDELQLPMLYVTHAADEVARLAHTLVVLEQGQVRAAGPVATVLSQLQHPINLGDDVGALIDARWVGQDADWHLAQVAFAGGSLWLRDSGRPTGSPARLRILARDVSLATVAPHQTSIQNVLACTLLAIQPDSHPSQVLLRLDCGGTILLARITARAAHSLQLAPGMAVWAQVKAVALVG